MYYASPLAESAMESVKDQGFQLPDKPKRDQPDLPDDLTDLDDDGLLDLMREFTSWADFAGAQVGMAVIAEREAEMELERITGVVWDETLADDPKKSVTVLKMVSLKDSRVYEARKSYEDSYAYRRIVTDISDRFERDAQMLSRELTRRTQAEFSARQRSRRWEA